MKLHAYFIRKFLGIFFGLLALFFAFQSLVDLVEHVRRFQAYDVPFSGLANLTLLNAPQGLYKILPLIMILSTIALFLGLARSSELVVVRASGRSALRALLAPALAAFLIGVILVAVFNPLVAGTAKRYQELAQIYKQGGADTLSISDEGLWLRQGGRGGQMVIHAGAANADATELLDVTFLAYAPEGGPKERIEAQKAQLANGAWALENAKLWPLGKHGNPEEGAITRDKMRVPSTLTSERILESFGTPSLISVWDLPAFVTRLKQAGFSSRRYEVWMQMELAQPLFLLSMVLIGAAFTMRPVRGGGIGAAVLTSILLGFGLYYIRNFAQVLGENGQIPVLLAAWAPPAASTLLALGLLLHMEDG